MPSVVHLIVTANFAGAERHVSDVAVETARRDWNVTVVGGDPRHVPLVLGDRVRWLPGATMLQALWSLARLGRQDVCHAHMTFAETVAVAARPLHRSPIVSTRHFAASRGSTAAGRLFAPLLSARIAREVAVSAFVASQMEKKPDVVIRNGVPPSPSLWRDTSRVVLVLQRLEPEKDTMTALRAWRASGLAQQGWSLRVVGEGSERPSLEAWTGEARVPAVTFVGWTRHVSEELAHTGMLLAPARAEPFGLGVVEAMAAGVPVVACAAGGHLETVGLLPEATMFPPGDTDAAAAALRALLPADVRAAASRAGRTLVGSNFTIARHVDDLLGEYEIARWKGLPAKSATSWRSLGAMRRSADPGDSSTNDLCELVVCSLEPWDDIWRRNQFFTDILLRRNPELRVLFVEPAADILFDLWNRRQPSLPRLRSISADGRLRAFRPLKPLPRRAGPIADGVVRSQVLLAARLLGFSCPTLWINDVTYAPLIARTGWPSLYDVTDDWLLAPFAPRELERLRRLDRHALDAAHEVVVCSPALSVSRGANRPVTLIPNGVDIEHFRRPRDRPRDLPGSPVAVYVGSLHEARIDVELVLEIARALPRVSLVFVGPNSFDQRSQWLLDGMTNVFLLGPRPYRDIPAYLQHADVVIVPHRISPFTESLDPIKAYECLAVGAATVATPVSGFRGLGRPVTLASPESFAAAMESALSRRAEREPAAELISWEERARRFEQIVLRAQIASAR